MSELTPIQESLLWIGYDGHMFAVLLGELTAEAETLETLGLLKIVDRDGEHAFVEVTEAGAKLGGEVADKMHRKVLADAGLLRD